MGFVRSFLLNRYNYIFILFIPGLFYSSCKTPRVYICGLAASTLQCEQAYLQLTPALNRPVIITSKTIAMDSIRSKNIKHCDVPESHVNTFESCILKRGNTKFVKRQTAFYDLSQNLLAVNWYAPMGAVSYTYEEMVNDRLLLVNMDISLLANFTLSKTRRHIIDNNDTLWITAHWPEQKLLFTHSDKLPKDRVVIYGYE
jgi:hypothetical protein